MHGSMNAVGGLIHDDRLLHCFEDPFVVFLELVNMPMFLDFVNNHFVFKLLFDWSLSRYFILLLNKVIQGSQPLDKILAWLHWVFDFT